MAHERKCIVDSKIYQYCPRCREYNSDEKWRLIYCSEDCKNADEILKQFKAGQITASKAKKALAKYNIDTTNGTSYTQPLFDAIFVNDVKEETKTEKVAETVVEEPTIEVVETVDDSEDLFVSMVDLEEE